MSKDWSAAQYLRFETERNLAVYDLISKVKHSHLHTAIDLGCGPGNSTLAILNHYPQAKIWALDNSADMLVAAKQRLPQVNFEQGDIQLWNPTGSTWDLIFANASLHWIPNHAELLPRLVSKLNSQGILAIQMPDNLNEPSHNLMQQVAEQSIWRKKLENAIQSRATINSTEWYYNQLAPICTQVDIWRTTYYHVIANGVAGIVEWFKGSGLRPYLQCLNPQEQQAYLSLYQQALTSAYPSLSNNAVLLAFPRLFIVAKR